MKPNVIVASAGVQAAKRWLKAMHAHELAKIIPRIEEILRDDDDDKAEDAFFLLDESAYTVAERLYMLIADVEADNFERGDAAAFWESVCDDPAPEVDFVFGFALAIRVTDVAEGALC